MKPAPIAGFIVFKQPHQLFNNQVLILMIDICDVIIKYYRFY